MNFLRRCDALMALSLFYLIFPWIIFCFGWMHLQYAILCFALIAAAIFFSDIWVKFPAAGPQKHKLLQLAEFYMAGLWAALWVCRSGIGGFAFQLHDWQKHNSILYELTHKSWPLVLEFSNGANPPVFTSLPMSYYISYYLPAALTGKIFGASSVEIALLIYSIFGVWLGLLWVARFVPKYALYGILIFPWLGGLDYFGQTYYTVVWRNLGDHLEWWQKFRDWQYSSNAALLIWVPQHGISGWLAAAMAIQEIFVKKTNRSLMLIVGAALSWSPFVSIGTAILGLYSIFKNSWRSAITRTNFLALIGFGLSSGLYIVSNRLKFGIDWVPFFPENHWLKYMGFMIVEIWLFIAFMRTKSMSHVNIERSFILFLFAILSLMPFVRYGLFNDLMMRASIPLLFTMWVGVLNSLLDFRFVSKLDFVKWLALLVVVAGGSVSATSEMLSVHKFDFELKQKAEHFRPHSFKDLDFIVANQYGQSKESFFFRYLQKPIAP